MPARKPHGLNRGHTTKEQDERRIDAERALTPEGDVFKVIPPNLKGRAYARAMWKRLADLYGSLEASIVSSLDRDMLIDYCLTSEQVVELDEVRGVILKGMRKKASILTIEELVKVDARCDRKRALLHQMRQSLYLTPRARAATTPKKKPKPKPVDPLEEMLADVDVEVLDRV